MSISTSPDHIPSQSRPTGSDSIGRRGWILLLVLCGTLFLDGLDVSMVGVALPSVGEALDLQPSTLQWVISGYVLGYGGFLLLGGRSADLLGRRNVLLVGLGVFAVASVLTGIATNGELLIGARFIKGAAAAFTAPATLSIITTRFPEGPQRVKALTVYTATGASGFSLGLVLGGLLTSLGWRWTFLLPGPLALVLLALGLHFVPRDTHVASEGRRHYDLPGAATITAAMLTLVITVVRAPDKGWGSVATVGGFVAAVALLAVFLLIETRSKAPLVRLGILRTPGLAAANLTAMTVFGSYVAFQFIAALYLQQTLGWSAVTMAFGLLPMGLLVIAAARPVGTLITRFGPSVPLVGGMAAFVAGYAVFSRIGPSASYLTVILPSVLLLGLGFAMSFASINTAATTGVRDEEQGLASGLVQTSFQIGGAVLLAVSTAVVESTTGSGAGGAPTALDRIDGYQAGLWVSTAAAAAGLVLAMPALRRSLRTARAANAGNVIVLPAERDADTAYATAD